MTKLFSTLTETDCNACISEFDDDGGCTCLENPSCDPTGLIPEGCYQCGDKAMEFCRSGNFWIWKVGFYFQNNEYHLLKG